MIRLKHYLLIFVCVFTLTNISDARRNGKRSFANAFPNDNSANQEHLFSQLTHDASAFMILAILHADNSTTLLSNRASNTLYDVVRGLDRLLRNNRIRLPGTTVMALATARNEGHIPTPEEIPALIESIPAAVILSTLIRELAPPNMPIVCTERVSFLLLFVNALDARTRSERQTAICNLLEHLLICATYAYDNLQLTHHYNVQTSFLPVELPFYILLLRCFSDFLSLINLSQPNLVAIPSRFNQTLNEHLHTTNRIPLINATSMFITVLSTLANILPNDIRMSASLELAYQRSHTAPALPILSNISLDNLTTTIPLLRQSIFMNDTDPRAGFLHWLREIHLVLTHPNDFTSTNTVNISEQTPSPVAPIFLFGEHHGGRSQ